MKKIEDFDLDVMNVLNDFPKNEEDSFLFIRGKIDTKKEKIYPGFVHTRATNETVATMLYSFIKMDENAKRAVFNAVISCLKKGTEEERIFFLSHFK